jgi:hypothetical protein
LLYLQPKEWQLDQWSKCPQIWKNIFLKQNLRLISASTCDQQCILLSNLFVNELLERKRIKKVKETLQLKPSPQETSGILLSSFYTFQGFLYFSKYIDIVSGLK